MARNVQVGTRQTRPQSYILLLEGATRLIMTPFGRQFRDVGHKKGGHQDPQDARRGAAFSGTGCSLQDLWKSP